MCHSHCVRNVWMWSSAISVCPHSVTFPHACVSSEEMEAECSSRTVRLSSLASEVAPFCIRKVMQLFQDLKNWINSLIQNRSAVLRSSWFLCCLEWQKISLLLMSSVFREPTAQTLPHFWETLSIAANMPSKEKRSDYFSLGWIFVKWSVYCHSLYILCSLSDTSPFYLFFYESKWINKWVGSCSKMVVCCAFQLCCLIFLGRGFYFLCVSEVSRF